MTVFKPKAFFARFFERESLQPDLSRAFRAMIGFMVPLLLIEKGWLHVDATYACIGAQSIAMVDVRGPYSFRLALLLSMTCVLAGAVALGAFAAPSLPFALIATLLIAALGGLWRHLSNEYGATLAIASGLVFFIALSGHGLAAMPILHQPAIVTLFAGLFGTLLQVAYWPFRPQHPLRRAVADSWMALGDLCAAMAPDQPDRAQAIADKESALRVALDKTYATLAAANKRSGKLLGHLEALHLAAARLAMRILAFNTAVESLMDQPGFARLAPAMQPALTSLTNTSRTIALAVVSRQPSHFATFEVRIKRLQNLLTVLPTQVKSQLDDPHAGEQLNDILRQIEYQLPVVREALRATIERASERAAFSMELFDMQTWTLQPLAASLNFNPRIDPSISRHAIRLGFLTMLGVAAGNYFHLPHSYWLPFTMLVVMQPDYGSTRQRAAQRMAGTIVGSLLASSLLWLHPPLGVLLSAIGLTVFIYAYYLKRSYGISVIFITLCIVLLTESSRAVTLDFTLERTASTLAGGLLALLAALIFWPVWERKRFPPIMAKALATNRDYLILLNAYLTRGGLYDTEIIKAKRTVESANSDVFSSLHRMIADPKNQQEGLAQAAAIANGNQRITRALTVVALHLNNRPTHYPDDLARFDRVCTDAFAALIATEENGSVAPELQPALTALETFKLPLLPRELDTQESREHWNFPQLTRIITELSAMLLAATAPVEKTTGETLPEVTTGAPTPQTGSS